MSSIFDLLNINKETFREFPLQANLIADYQIGKVINSNTKRLKEIENVMLSDKLISVSPQSVEEVIHKVKKAAETTNIEENWTTQELRIISYYLTKLQDNNKAFSYALFVLDNNWRNLFFSGLIFYIMNSWNNNPKTYRNDVCALVKSQLNKYQDDNKKYLILKNHANFFEETGPLRLARLLKHRNMNIFDAPTIIGYKPSTISLAYYSDVIINYFKNDGTTELSQIEEALIKHGLNRTKKLLFADLVEDADRNGSDVRQSQISKFASRIMGDISLSVTWAPFNDATPEEVEKLRNARRLINKWYARKVIEVFFDICVQDIYRKNYWLRYLEVIEEFRISGSMAVKLSLNSDFRINDMFQNYFIETNSRKVKTAALILYIRNKIFVEFSDLGSLYIYNKDNYTVKSLTNKRYIDSINNLKNTNLPQAVVFNDYDYYHFNDEGSMRHAGYWQERLDKWFRNVLNINV